MSPDHSCYAAIQNITRTWTAKDACGNSATGVQIITRTGCGCGCSYTQGGWGAPPNGNNIAQYMTNKFSMVYSTVPIGPLIGRSGISSARWSTAAAVINYLPAGGTPSTLATGNVVNPTSTPAGSFGGQVLALTLNVNFSSSAPSALIPAGFGDLLYCNKAR